jgi:general secretion pathway protein B
MSYILDALKKADAQRERDPARGIHAQPAVHAAAPRGDAPAPWLWAGAAVVVAVVAMAGWYLHEDHADTSRPAAVAMQSAPVAPQRGAMPAAAPAPLSSAPIVAGAAAQPPAASGAAVATAVLPPAEPARATAPAGAQEDGPGPMQRRRRVPAPVAAAPVPAPATTGTATAAAPAPGAAVPPPAVAPASPSAKNTAAVAVPAANEPAAVATGLPPDAPKLAISGGVYSGNRSQRMLIVNGQVVNEGADLGAGVVLEEIRPKAAVLRYRGARYSVGF